MFITDFLYFYQLMMMLDYNEGRGGVKNNYIIRKLISTHNNNNNS